MIVMTTVHHEAVAAEMDPARADQAERTAAQRKASPARGVDMAKRAAAGKVSNLIQTKAHTRHLAG